LSPLRSTPGTAAIAAAAAGLCLLLGACSGGSATSAANTSAPSSGASASSSATPSSASSSTAGSGGSTTSAPAAVSTAGLTGNFCKDFTRMSENLGKLPQPTDQGNLAADQADARRIITQAEANFNGLATEAPPTVAAAIHNITAQYQVVLGEVSTFGSLAQIKVQEHKFVTSPGYLASIRVLVEYMVTKCH
jgi:hypothetical protein